MAGLKSIVNELLAALQSENPSRSDEELRSVGKSLRAAIRAEREESPPVIALIGLTGVGKSSTINALFNAGVEVSHFEPCTQVAAPIAGDLFQFTGRKGKLIIYDMPGLGEGKRADERHFATYRETLPTVDAAVWVIAAPERAMTPIQTGLERLAAESGSAVTDKIVFAINKIDRVHPGETAWNPTVNLPGPEQAEILLEYTKFVDRAITEVLPERSGQTVPYSATRRYNLESLMEQIVARTADNRAWLVGKSASVADFTELVDPRFLEWYRRNYPNEPRVGRG